MNKTIEEIVEENFKGLSDFIDDKDILDWYKRLIATCIEEYATTSDVAVKFANWKLEFVDYDEKEDDYYFMPNMVVKTEKELFTYFINNIYGK